LSGIPKGADTSAMAQRRNVEEMDGLVERYRASGLTQIEYCRQTGMVLSTLGRYLRRRSATEQRLLRVKVEPASEPGEGFVVALGNGRRIERGWRFGDADLARLIRVAESA
jgi:hypothetical protein